MFRLTLFYLVLHAMIWYCMRLDKKVCYGMVGSDMGWYGMVWYDMGRYGMVWYGLLLYGEVG